MAKRTSRFGRWITWHLLALGLAFGLMGMGARRQAQSRRLATEMAAVQQAGRLISGLRKPDSETIVPGRQGKSPQRLLVFEDPLGSVEYLIYADPRDGSLLDFVQLHIEYARFSVTWPRLMQLSRLGLLVILASLAWGLARRFAKRRRQD